MKNQIQLTKKKNNLKNMCAFFCLLAFAFVTTNGVNAQPEVCNRVKIIVQADAMNKGKISSDSVIVFLSAKNADDAFKQAQDFCIKLHAKLSEKKGNSTIYTLPDESGKITIRALKGDECIYAILYLGITCDGFPVKEIRFTRLKYYKDLKE